MASWSPQDYRDEIDRDEPVWVYGLDPELQPWERDWYERYKFDPESEEL